MNLTEIDTMQELRQWVKENMPNAIVVDCDDEVIIQTLIDSLFEKIGTAKVLAFISSISFSLFSAIFFFI